MFTPLKTALVATAIAITANATAGELYEAQIAARVSQNFSGGEVASCGMTFFAVETPKTPVSKSVKLLAFNGSFSLIDLEGGLIKGRASEVPESAMSEANFNTNSVKALPTTDVWIKGPNANRTQPRNGAIGKSDDPGFLLYATSYESVLGIIDAIHNQQPIQIGIHVAGRKFDEVLYGPVSISSNDKAQLVQCISDWVKVKKKQIEGSQ